jgi:hypothetical protein
LFSPRIARNALDNAILLTLSPMRIPGRLLLISVLGAGLYLQGSSFSSAQKPGAVTVRAQISAPQTGMPEVKAAADRKRVPLGETVTFTLSPAWVLSDSRYKVTLFFGDGSRRIMRQPQTTYLYQAVGTYTYAILVEAAKTTPRSTPLPPPNARLSVSPSSIDTKTAANFTAELSRNTPGIRYMFVFGDGTDTGWQTGAKTTHVYRAPNTYLPYVDIGISANGSTTRLGGSTRGKVIVNQPGNLNANRNGNSNGNQTTNSDNNRNGNIDGNSKRPSNQNRNSGGNVNQNGNDNATSSNSNSSTDNNSNSRGSVNDNLSPSSSASFTPLPEGTRTTADDWWPYWLLIPLLLLGAYQAAKYLLASKPTFVPNFDPGQASLGGNRSLGFDHQLDLNPNLNAGESKIETQGKNLIKATRIE